MTIINQYNVRIVDEKNRINELIEECVYDIHDVPHIDMNEFVESIIKETVDVYRDAVASGMDAEGAVRHHFGLDN